MAKHFLLFYLKLACHLVVSASSKRFGETVGSYGQNLQGKKWNLFRSLSPQPPLLVLNSDLKLRATEALMWIKSWVVSYFNLHPWLQFHYLSMTKPAFLLKLAFPYHTTDYSIYWVIKIRTKRSFDCWVISQSLCGTILFVPISLFSKQLHVCSVCKPHRRHQLSICTTLDDRL